MFEQRNYFPFDINNDPNALSRAVVSALHIGCLLSSLIDADKVTPQITKQILYSLYKLNSLKVTVRSGKSALHFACYKEGTLVGRYPTCQFPSPSLAKALLEVGANPNDVDDNGNTPLHLAASIQPCSKTLIRTLLNYGAHLVNRIALKIY